MQNLAYFFLMEDKKKAELDMFLQNLLQYILQDLLIHFKVCLRRLRYQYIVTLRGERAKNHSEFWSKFSRSCSYSFPAFKCFFFEMFFFETSPLDYTLDPPMIGCIL